jgi:hypothetical protein
MISSKLFLFIERVVAAEMDIIVQRGFVHLGSSGGSRATTKMGNDLSAQLTDDPTHAKCAGCSTTARNNPRALPLGGATRTTSKKRSYLAVCLPEMALQRRCSCDRLEWRG